MITSLERNFRLRCTVTSVSGGNMKLYDRDNSNRIVTRYYQGSTTSGYSTFIFDFDDPYHCVDVISGCRSTMLHAGDDATSQVRFCRCRVLFYLFFLNATYLCPSDSLLTCALSEKVFILFDLI